MLKAQIGRFGGVAASDHVVYADTSTESFLLRPGACSAGSAGVLARSVNDWRRRVYERALATTEHSGSGNAQASRRRDYVQGAAFDKRVVRLAIPRQKRTIIATSVRLEFG